MIRFTASLALVLTVVASAFATANTDSSDVSKLLKKQFGAKNVSIIFDDNNHGFVAKISLKNDSLLILTGGIGKSSDEEISRDFADIHATTTAIAFIQGKFKTNEPIAPMSLTTALAQKGEWVIERANLYTYIKVLDANKLL